MPFCLGSIATVIFLFAAPPPPPPALAVPDVESFFSQPAKQRVSRIAKTPSSFFTDTSTGKSFPATNCQQPVQQHRPDQHDTDHDRLDLDRVAVPAYQLPGFVHEDHAQHRPDHVSAAAKDA